MTASAVAAGPVDAAGGPPAAAPFLGAYALLASLPGRPAGREYAALRSLPISGLEMPLAHALDRRWLDEVLVDEWELVLTCIPTVMERLRTAPGYGLASTDPAGRAAATADAAAALSVARRLADEAGRPRVLAVQVHSAPGRGRGGAGGSPGASPEALARSLAALAEHDGAGAVLALEHCDAPRNGQAPHKGFLELAEELAVVDRCGPGVGITVNWGRSTIEGRSTATPERHVLAAARAGRLAGVMYSGATSSPGPWGPPWDDSHMPPRGSHPALSPSSASLLDARAVRRTERAAAAGGAAPLYRGIKVTVQPAGASLTDRVAVARACVELLGQPARR